MISPPPGTPESTQSIGPRQAATTVPGPFIGRFELLRLLGRGGFGAVYDARDSELGRHVAVKLVRPERLGATDRAALLELFRREAEAAARLNHVHIITIHDYGTHDGAPYLVLELLAGETLARRLDRGPLPADEAVAILLQICRGLQHAHAAGVIHRDLKPGNVFVRADGQVKILDFGLARVAEALTGGAGGEAPTGGTPAYMAPEQWRGEAEDERTDLFACGVMLFEMLCGRLPFAVSDRGRSDLEEGRRSLSSHMVGLPPDVVAVTERALAPDPQDRYASAGELYEALLRLAPPGEGAAPTDEPYRYLEQFSEADASWFFGREREVSRLSQMLAVRPFVALVGPSGAGKSSLVHAGLIPRLRRERKWTVVAMRPGGEPLRYVHERLVEVCGKEPVTRLLPDADALVEAPGRAGRLLREHARETQTSIVFVVDQLEELVTHVHVSAVRRAFAEALLSLADDAAGPIRVVVALRDDFLVKLSKHTELSETLVRNMVLVGPPDAEGLAETLRGPTARLGYEYEQGLVDEMVAAVADEAAPLPLLQLAASRLWERRDTTRRLLTRAGLAAAGGVAGILAAHANEILHRLAGPDEVGIARRILCDLVTDEGTRRRTRRDEVVQRFDDPRAASRVLERLVSGRLVTASRGEKGEWVELAHESLIAGWTQLRDWLDEDRADRPFRERLLAAATLWQERKQPRDLLWRGDTLDEALRWRRRYQGSLSPPEQAFLSRAEARAHRARRLRRRLLVGSAAVAVAATLGFLLTVRAYRAAARAARLREIVRTAGAAEDPLLGALILAEFEGQPEPPGGAAAAVQVAARPIPLVEYRGHQGSLMAGAWSPDGKWVVTGAWDGQVHVWRADGTGRPIVLKGHRSWITIAGFSPDGRRVVSASQDDTARIWRADGMGEPIVLPDTRGARFIDDARVGAPSQWREGGIFLRIWRADGRGEPVVFRHEGKPGWWTWEVSPDGTQVVAAGPDGIGLWRADDGTPIVFRPEEDSGDLLFPVLHFSADGSRINTCHRGEKAGIRVWRADLTAPVDLPWDCNAEFSPDEQRVVHEDSRGGLSIVAADGTGGATEVTGASMGSLAGYWFSPDGSRVITTGDAVRLWPVDGTGAPIVLEGHAGRVRVTAIDPDGTRVLTASDDGTARIWKVGDPPGIRFFRGHALPIESVRVSPDGNLLLTASHDGTARLWRLGGGAPAVLGTAGGPPLNFAAFSRDGSRIATAEDVGVRVWPVAGGEPLALPIAGRFNAVDFSPDGTWIAAARGNFPEVIVARSDGSGEMVTLKPAGARWASFSPDGSRLLTGMIRLRLWRTDDWSAAPMIIEVASPLDQSAFHPTGSMILTGSSDKVRVFSLDGRERVELQRPGGSAVAWSSNGELIATGLLDGSARISRLDLGRETIVLRGHEGSVNGLAFAPDGRRVATASSKDTSARLWLIDWAELVHALRTSTNACLTVDQRVTYLDETPEKARTAWEACERRFGRAPGAP